MGKASVLEYDTEELRAQAGKVREIKSRLQENKRALSGRLESLRTVWASDASDKFFASYDANWVTHIDAYCEMLEELATALDDSAGKYEPLSDSYNRIAL